MLKIKEAIVVEGRYDKNTLSQVVDALIIPVDGFQIFKKKNTVQMLRKLAATQGLIIFTDSDGAGFVIRNHLKGVLPQDQVKHAYIPDIYGKERRKATAGKEGKLGVEGMRPEVLKEALLRAGATVVGEEMSSQPRRQITRSDLFTAQLTGCAGSQERRKKLLHQLDLPEHSEHQGAAPGAQSTDELRRIHKGHPDLVKRNTVRRQVCVRCVFLCPCKKVEAFDKFRTKFSTEGATIRVSRQLGRNHWSV